MSALSMPTLERTPEERVDHLVGNCEITMLRAAQMVRAAIGLDAALRTIGRVTQALREGRE